MVGRKRLPVKLCCQNKIYSRLPEDEVQLSHFKRELWGGFKFQHRNTGTNNQFLKSMISEFSLITKIKQIGQTFLENFEFEISDLVFRSGPHS